MDLASLFKDESISKHFKIARLVYTTLRCFATAHGLYQKVQQGRADRKRNTETSEPRLRGKKERKEGKRRNQDYGEPGGFVAISPLGRSLQESEAAIYAVYGDHRRLGDRFMIGDSIGYCELLEQKLRFQQTVIEILRDAAKGRGSNDQIDTADLAKASEIAREGVLQALSRQYYRLLEPASPRKALLAPPSSYGDTYERSLSPSARRAGREDLPEAAHYPPNSRSLLFCLHSSMLQQSPNAAVIHFSASHGAYRCDECYAMIRMERNTALRICTSDYSDGYERREFDILDRFFLKCHRTCSGFACVLCYRMYGIATIRPDEKSLARHLRDHSWQELERDIDIDELT